MGTWVNCNNCSGLGIKSCACAGESEQCQCCQDTGEISCPQCKGTGSLYLNSYEEALQEQDFVYDEAY